ncbi:ABC transporter permease [Synoicihabitans lomoniglobus]|uniref:FtsX-like permease family protein n=1 Tax=Synoicihabitans lomoniglobus TaxID=2909285 RepID=A0AAF0CSN7_9BACT|nr:FtsX-like permease family protein [Opitutaceae bacterium LMO-M01]WED67352.1 FtsX-like permease family protein [Opitutaceae bacterium LMO-M01]
MSLSCIVLGIGLFIITQATTSGFEKFFIRTILGTNGAIRIADKMQDTMGNMMAAGYDPGESSMVISNQENRKYIEGIEEPRLLINALKPFANVAAISQVVTGSVTAESSFKSEDAKVYGIELDDHIAVSDLENQIVDGDLGAYRVTPLGVIVGSQLARRLRLSPGDSLLLQTREQNRRYTVAAVFETGVADLDRERIYMHLGESRSLLKKTSGATFLQVGLIEPDRAPGDALLMSETLRYNAESWQHREKTWLDVFGALRISSAITVSVFTLIAGLAMFNTLAMIVMEKTKDIAILRSMGYTRDDVSQIFLWQALIVLMIGTVLGCLLGAGGTYAISHVPVRITGIFATDTFIVAWSIWHYVAAVITAIIMVMLASLVPAQRAARLEPGDVIRGTAQ